MMKKTNEPCAICENYIADIECINSECPVYRMKFLNMILKEECTKLEAENKKLKIQNEQLRIDMSYMKNPNTIGDSHEMGSW